MPAFFAAFNATVATGTPFGICKIERTESQPSIELLDLIGNDSNEQALHELFNDFERVENVNRHDIKQTLQKVIPKNIEEKAQLVARLNHGSATPQAKAVAQIFE